MHRTRKARYGQAADGPDRKGADQDQRPDQHAIQQPRPPAGPEAAELVADERQRHGHGEREDQRPRAEASIAFGEAG
jgi:hypothetical protein